VPHIPDFLWSLVGSTKLYAPFLKERRTRCCVQGRVKEIRGISLVFREMWDTTALDLQTLESNRLSEAIDGCPRFAPACSGFPVELSGVGALQAAFLKESRTRGFWWCPVQEIRIPGPKKMGEAQQSLSQNSPTFFNIYNRPPLV
jgi:hypothetical protein